MTEESIAAEVLSASLGGAISAAVLYPLEVLKTKMQAETKDDKNKKGAADDDDDDDDDSAERQKDHNDKSKLNMIDYATYLYKTQGIRVFISGFETSAFQSATEKALYFFAYTAFKHIYRAFHGPHSNPNTITSLILGCAAEWAHLPITLPLDCWTTAIQTNQDSTRTPMQLLLTMLSEKGIKGMYKGIQAYTVLCLKPALQYTVFEHVKSAVIRNRPTGRLMAAEAFILGMIARTISTICIFPYIRAKVMLQTSSSTNANIPQMMKEMYLKDGFSSWFQGLGPELTRGVLSSALMLMIKDQIGFIVEAALAANRSKRNKIKKNRM